MVDKHGGHDHQPMPSAWSSLTTGTAQAGRARRAAWPLLSGRGPSSFALSSASALARRQLVSLRGSVSAAGVAAWRPFSVSRQRLHRLSCRLSRRHCTGINWSQVVSPTFRFRIVLRYSSRAKSMLTGLTGGCRIGGGLEGVRTVRRRCDSDEG